MPDINKKELQKSVFWWVDEDFEEKAKNKSHKAFDYTALRHHSEDGEDESDEESEEDPDVKTREHALVSVEEMIRYHGIPASEVLHYCTAEISAMESCRSLPFTLLLVVSYALMIVFHDNAPFVNAVEDSVAQDVIQNANFAFSSEFMGHKDIFDVNSHADFWSWMIRGFIPQIYQHKLVWAETRDSSDITNFTSFTAFPREDRGVLLHYNRIIMGVRLSQERFGDGEDTLIQCRGNPSLDLVYDKECVAGQGYELEPEMFEARVTKNPVRIHWLYIHDNVEKVVAEIFELEKSGWLDEKTKKIEAAIAVYNGEYGLHSLVMFDFFFSRGGRVWKDVIPLSAFANMYMNWYNYAFDSVWACCIFYILLSEGKEVLLVYKRHGKRGLWKEYLGFWNLVDWVSAVTGMAIIVMSAVNQAKTITLNGALEELAEVNETTQQETYREKGNAYWEALEQSVHFFYWFRMALAAYPLVIVMRLFKAFNAQPRLAVVTQTLTEAASDLWHFMIIFVSIFLTYAVAGVVLFGRETKAFTTVFRAINTCFRMANGDFDWDEMRQGVGREDATMWFVPFTLLIVMLLLNMLVAIIMDTYAEVKTQIVDAEPLWVQGWKVWRNWVTGGNAELVTLPTVKSVVQKWKEEHDYFRRHSSSFRDFLDDHSHDIAESRSDGVTISVASRQSLSEERQVRKDGIHLLTTGKLKSLFEAQGIEMKRAQRQTLLADAVMHYHTVNYERASNDKVYLMVSGINYRTRKLKDKMKEKHQKLEKENRESKSIGKARHHLREVANLDIECRVEMTDARKELAGWLPDDPDDIPLPPHFLEKYAEAQAAGATASASSKDRGAASGGALRSEAPISGGNVLRPEAAGTVQIVASASRKDEQDNSEGSTKVSDNTPDSYERRLEALEQELQLGRETVAEALQAVRELHQRLLRSKADRRRGVERYRQFRQKERELTRENRAHRERFQQSQVTLKVTTSERDEYYEQARALHEENKQLEAELANEEAPRPLQHSRSRDAIQGPVGADARGSRRTNRERDRELRDSDRDRRERGREDRDRERDRPSIGERSDSRDRSESPPASGSSHESHTREDHRDRLGHLVERNTGRGRNVERRSHRESERSPHSSSDSRRNRRNLKDFDI